jgi:xanthine dehydrogenase accessory factor
MTTLISNIASHWLSCGDLFAILSISEALGSTPREEGAIMLVSASSVVGTIGGGRLEWDAIATARAMLTDGHDKRKLTVVLGTAIGQCCGGRVTLCIEKGTVERTQALQSAENIIANAVPHILIYGAGHVGRALAGALAPLPFKTTLIDSRESELALVTCNDVTLTQTDRPISLAENAPAGAAHVIMTHSHALDSLLAAAVLEQDDFRYLGIIGSKTKRNSFRRAFRELGIPPAQIARVVCPIGGKSVHDKRPEVIAALVAAELIGVLLGGIGG